MGVVLLLVPPTIWSIKLLPVKKNDPSEIEYLGLGYFFKFMIIREKHIPAWVFLSESHFDQFPVVN